MRVSLPDGTPDAKASVGVSRAGAAYRNPVAHRLASTDEGGRCEFDGLAAGEHRIVVPRRNGESTLADLFSPSGCAKVVTVVAGEVTEIDL